MKDRYYQTEAHEAGVEYILKKKGHPFFFMTGGSGKSHQMAKFGKHSISEWKANVMVLAHTKELVRQNYKAFCNCWPEGRRYAGINCASLDCRDYNKKIIYASIQSVYKDAELFPKINCLIIDEAHRVMVGKDAGVYRRFINELLKVNPKMRILGFSAQDWREDSGKFVAWTRHHTFNETVYRLPNSELVARKYLSPLINKASRQEAKPDVSNVPIGESGEFVESLLEDVVLSKELVKAQVDGTLETLGDRVSPLIFCVTIKHADMVYKELISRGETAVNINYKLSSGERDKAFEDFETHKAKFFINVGIAKEGYDNDKIDHISFYAPWNSKGSTLQGCLRGSRVEKVKCSCGELNTDLLPCGSCGKDVKRTKKDCYIFDPAGNINRHGTIDDLEATTSVVPEKVVKFKKCRSCFEKIAVHLKTCPFCGYVFETQDQNRKSSGRDTTSIPVLTAPVWMAVSKIQVSKSTKKPRTNIIANFYCGEVKLLQNIELKNPTPEEKWAIDLPVKHAISGTEYVRLKQDRYATKPTEVLVISDHGNLKIIGVK